MLLDARLALYLGNIMRAVKKGKYVEAPMVCPECQIDADDVRHDTSHMVIVQIEEGKPLHYVIIGCEGYWAVNPNDYGVPDKDWSPATI